MIKKLKDKCGTLFGVRYFHMICGFSFFLGFVLSGFRNLPGLCLVVLPVSEGNCQVGTGFSYHQSKRQSDRR